MRRMARQAFYLDKAKTQGKVDSASHQQHDSKGKRAQDRQGLIGMEHSRHVPEKKSLRGPTNLRTELIH